MLSSRNRVCSLCLIVFLNDHAVLLNFIFCSIIKVRDTNVLSFASPNIWGRLFSVVGGLVLCVQDQYLNHIMAETGVTVSLRGLGSESTEGACEGTSP